MRTGWTRRDVLRSAAVAAPLVLASRRGLAAGLAAGLVRGGQPAPFPDLRPGMRVGRCTLVAVRPEKVGGVQVLLAAPDGRTFQVDVLRHDPATPGVARGGSLEVYVKNAGGGTRATDEEQGLGAMALAQVLAKREAEGRPVPALLTLRERTRRL